MLYKNNHVGSYYLILLDNMFILIGLAIFFVIVLFIVLYLFSLEEETNLA